MVMSEMGMGRKIYYSTVEIDKIICDYIEWYKENKFVTIYTICCNALFIVVSLYQFSLVMLPVQATTFILTI